MSETISPCNTPEQNRFVSIADFEFCMMCHGEVEFIWKGQTYNITYPRDGVYCIYVSFREDTEMYCSTADEILEYNVGGDRLRDVITQVTVTARTI